MCEYAGRGGARDVRLVYVYMFGIYTTTPCYRRSRVKLGVDTQSRGVVRKTSRHTKNTVHSLQSWENAMVYAPLPYCPTTCHTSTHGHQLFLWQPWLHGRNRQHDWQRRLGRLGWLGRVPRPLRARLQPRALPWRWHRPPRPHCRHLDGVLALACSHCLCLRHGRSHCTCDGLVDGRLRVRLRCSRHCLGHLSCRRGRTTSATSCRRASSLSRESLCCSRRCCSRSCSICARLAARLAACSRRSAASSAAACSRARHALRALRSKLALERVQRGRASMEMAA